MERNRKGTDEKNRKEKNVNKIGGGRDKKRLKRKDLINRHTLIILAGNKIATLKFTLHKDQTSAASVKFNT